RRLFHFFTSLPLASRQSEVRTGMGIWNPWNRDADRDFVFLGRSQQNGARASGWTWLSARNIQQGRSHHTCANRDGLRFYFGFLGPVGNEQRSRMDVTSRENGSACVLAAVDQHWLFAISCFSGMGFGFAGRASANCKPYFDPDFYPLGELCDLPAD